MATAPRPGTTPSAQLPAATFFVDGEPVTVDLRTLTLGERRLAKQELAKLGETDEVEALAALLWVILRRDQPDLDFEELLYKVTFADLASIEEADAPAETDDPSQ